MKRLQEIEARKAEIRKMLEGNEDVDVKALTEEVRKLNEEKEKIEARENLKKNLGTEPEGANKQPNKKPEEDTESRSMQTATLPERGVVDNTPVMSQESRDFQTYLETRAADIQGGSLKTDSGFVVIPEEIVNDIMKLKEMEYNLDKYVTIKPVKNGSGKYPVVRTSDVAALPEVAELAENPELAVKPFFMLGYDIKTYRGYFLISKEAIEDAQVDVLAELKTWLARTIAATRNAAILKVLKDGGKGEDGASTKFETKDATGIDGLKDVVNKNIKPNYENNLAIMSQSAYAALDKLKDGNGNYLLQADVKETTAKRLLGARIEVLPDEMLPDNVDAHQIILGNMKDGIVLFSRSQYQAQWTDYMHFGEALMVAVRQDARILDKKSVIIVNFTPEAAVVPGV
ncbi:MULTISPECIES: phage major capsid protein [unclassified Sporosarcina]|uniref:phage major capsid protein n=1 Tax=unclassified Sporosarcina TaxID=2647733 RepID=UPI00203EBA57|nr:MULTISPECIES: phage major capsid protein [unclassified Sporosarcina]GKV67468.1 phage capsid protein [Sporosarcina sp. NCCP-2331]GLB57833.1 phage capsid protein [Sporosarcina sp. NCCP-2378]